MLWCAAWLILLLLQSNRDREHQILRIEEAKHRSREKEHGKNYLLETYLNGLNGADDRELDGCKDENEKDEDEGEDDANAANRSDSGVHEGTSSPEVGQSASNQGDNHHLTGDHVTAVQNDLLGAKYDSHLHLVRRKSISKRETELLQHHECSKELISSGHCLSGFNVGPDPETGSAAGDMAEQIEWLQKVIEINKHLQREEELVVRLTTKVRKYQADDRTMSAMQIQEAIGTVNFSLDFTTSEMERMQNELTLSTQILNEKENIILDLSHELEQLENSPAISTDQPITFNQTLLQHNQLPTSSLLPMYPFMDTISHQQTPVPIQMFRSTDPLYFEKRDCGIASINMLHLKKNLNVAQDSSMKVGPKKWLHKDPDSDTGLSSLGDDALLQVGTLV